MTLAELKEAVLVELGIIGAGESGQPDDVALVGDRYDALYDMLLAEKLVAWTATDDIPLYAETPVIQMLAYLCARPFGINSQRTAELEQAGALALAPARGGPSLAERQLRRQLARNHVPFPAASDYF